MGAAKKDPVIIFRGVSKTYKNVLGLNHVDIDIHEGVTGLLGPNGAGKSTFLKLCLGLIHPTAGIIRVLGKDPAKDPYIFRHLGFCPETESFYPGMTGVEFVTYFLRLQGMSPEEAEARGRIILERLELGHAGDRKIKGYSKGMKQKLKIARAVAHDPKVIFLDEPLQGADPKARHLIIENIHRWDEEGRTVIVSSHILSEVERMTDRIVLINKGRIYASGKVRALREKLERYPHKIRIVPRFEEDVRRLASFLAKEPLIVGLSIGEKDILTETREAGPFFRRLPSLLVEEGISVKEIHSEDESLENIYDYLMRGGF